MTKRLSGTDRGANSDEPIAAFTPNSRSGSLSAGVSRIPAIHLIFLAETTRSLGFNKQHIINDTDHISIVALHSVSGSACLHFENEDGARQIEVSAPSVVFFPLRQLRRSTVVGDHWRTRWYEFETGEDIESWLMRPIPVAAADANEETFTRIKRYIASERGNDLLYAAALFTEQIYRWLRDTEIDLRSADQQIVDEAATAFRRQIRQGVTVESVSEQVGIHSSSLRRLFRTHLSMSPKQYLDRLRYGEARRLLQDGMLVKQVAGMLGFENQSQFSRFFKTHSGIAPRDYRKRYNIDS